MLSLVTVSVTVTVTVTVTVCSVKIPRLYWYCGFVDLNLITCYANIKLVISGMATCKQWQYCVVQCSALQYFHIVTGSIAI